MGALSKHYSRVAAALERLAVGPGPARGRPAAADKGAAMLARLSARFAAHGPPIIVFNKSHSGSRVLAGMLREAGVYMGSRRNESEDPPDMLPLVHLLVERHYPDYAALMRSGDPDLEDTLVSVLGGHLLGRAGEPRWGWKLCETLYILPVLYRLFPDADFLHLVRDGRDVAFSDHVAPVLPFWRKVYFDTAAIGQWNGRRLDQRAYIEAPHVFNAQHWVNSVNTARRYGAMIGERYREIRYEDLATRPADTARKIYGVLGLTPSNSAVERFAASVSPGSVGKHRLQPARHLAEALHVLEPTLASFRYGPDASSAAMSSQDGS
jgi:hypothetical protein